MKMTMTLISNVPCFQSRNNNQKRLYASQRILSSRQQQQQQQSNKRPPLSLPQNQDELFSIEVAPHQPQFPMTMAKQPHSNRTASTFKHKLSSATSKPNSLPMLNCLFAALGKKDRGREDAPYTDVPDLCHRMNNNIVRVLTSD